MPVVAALLLATKESVWARGSPRNAIAENGSHGRLGRHSVKVWSEGPEVKNRGADIFKGWRRPIGWVAAYALVLQIVLGAFAGAQFSAHAVGQNWSFFEICYGKGASDGEVPDGQPAKQASKSFGCVVCANAAATVFPEVPAVVPAEFSTSLIEWSVRDDAAARTEFSFAQRQRAPPFAT